MYEVREATAPDVPGALDAYESVAGEGRWIGGELPIDRDDRRDRLGAAISSGETVMFVATSVGDDGIVGCSTQSWVGRPGSGLLSLGMWVVAAWRGRGVDSKLLIACIEWARANSAYKITLEVWPHNEPAISCTESSGFARRASFTNSGVAGTASCGTPFPWGSFSRARTVATNAPG